MITPVRLQLSRRKGFDLQRLSMETNGLPAVRVARPGTWGNMFRAGQSGGFDCTGETVIEKSSLTPADCVRLFRGRWEYWLAPGYPGRDSCREALDIYLRGKNLACWCPLDQPCHADVLLEIANASITS